MVSLYILHPETVIALVNIIVGEINWVIVFIVIYGF